MLCGLYRYQSRKRQIFRVVVSFGVLRPRELRRWKIAICNRTSVSAIWIAAKLSNERQNSSSQLTWCDSLKVFLRLVEHNLDFFHGLSNGSSQLRAWYQFWSLKLSSRWNALSSISDLFRITSFWSASLFSSSPNTDLRLSPPPSENGDFGLWMVHCHTTKQVLNLQGIADQMLRHHILPSGQYWNVFAHHIDDFAFLRVSQRFRLYRSTWRERHFRESTLQVHGEAQGDNGDTAGVVFPMEQSM